jgi:hypothetical protein
MIVYSNSCSYGVLSNGPVYSDFVANYYNAQLINHGQAGCCNERIFRTSTRDILRIVNNNNTCSKDLLVLIGLTNPFRGEFWGDNPGLHNDGHFESFTGAAWAGAAKKFQCEFYKIFNQEAATTNLLNQLSMFVGFLNNINIKYLIWTNTPDLKPIEFAADFVEPFYTNIQQNKNILSLFDFNFCNFVQMAGYSTIDKPFDQGGHPDTKSHQYFSEFLISKINNFY